MHKKVLATALAALSLCGPALADDDEACTKAPKEQWLSADQIKGRLTDQGYKVRKVEIEDGCAEVKADDKDGKKVELTLDPATAAVVKTDD